MDRFFTIGYVAKICKVAPRTVSKWLGSGRLKGYRIPSTGRLCIPRGHLIEFLKEQGMPLGELDETNPHPKPDIAQPTDADERRGEELGPELAKRREECEGLPDIAELLTKAYARVVELEKQLGSAAVILREHGEFHEWLVKNHKAIDWDEMCDYGGEVALKQMAWLETYDAEHPDAVKDKAAELREAINKGERDDG